MANPDVPNKTELYTQFIEEFQNKLNAISLVQILIGITRSDMPDDVTKALAFLEPHLVPESAEAKTMVTENPEAHVLLLSEIARLRLRAKDSESSKEAVEKSQELVDSTFEMAPIVHSAFFHAAAEFHKFNGTASEFFKNALQFLAYTPPESLAVAEQHQWAFDIGIAALIGQDIYNFGEVLSHGIFSSLSGGEHGWLFELLTAFHRGSLTEFDDVCRRAAAQMNAQPALVTNEEFIRQKITLLALMELAFARGLDRKISFSEVAVACRMQDKEVEYLLMRAMSLGLISGEIDNVDSVIHVARVQPRVLTREPIADMSKKLDAWCKNVSSTLLDVEGEAKELVS